MMVSSGCESVSSFSLAFSVRVRVRVAAQVLVLFGVWTQFTVDKGKRQWTPERNAIGHTHARASSGGAKAWDPMASSSVNFC
jgi:hypothetical protein